MAAAAATAGRGQVADYIPALASVDPDAFGMAMATFDGEIYGVGQVERPFSIQSVSKLFTLALLLAEIGDRVWQGVGREPSGNPFNSLVQLESERGIPRNPFINAGALVVTDRLLSATGDAAGEVREFLRTESGNSKLDTDRVVARSEAEQGHRNAALAHFIASYGNLQNPVDSVLDHYYAHCAIEASCRDLALAGLFLSKHGLRVYWAAVAWPHRRQANERGHADLRYLRRRRRVRLPGRAAGQERGRRGRAGRDPPARHPVRLGSAAGRRGQLGGRDRRPGRVHHGQRPVGVLTRGASTAGPRGDRGHLGTGHRRRDAGVCAHAAATCLSAPPRRPPAGARGSTVRARRVAVAAAGFPPGNRRSSARACQPSSAARGAHAVEVQPGVGQQAAPSAGHCQVVDLVWCCQDWSFVAIAARYKGYRYPIEVIGHAVWLYHRFTLSLRDVEELMLARGVVVTYATIRSWCAKFGPDYAAR